MRAEERRRMLLLTLVVVAVALAIGAVARLDSAPRPPDSHGERTPAADRGGGPARTTAPPDTAPERVAASAGHAATRRPAPLELVLRTDATFECVVQVVDARSGEPVPSAEVVCSGFEIDADGYLVLADYATRPLESEGEAFRRLGAVWTTDAEGLARIHLSVDHPSVHAFAGDRYGRAWIEEPGPGPTVVRIAPEWTVEGRVIDTAGRPVSGVPIELVAHERLADGSWERIGRAGSTRSADEGRFRLPHLQCELDAFDLDAGGHPRLTWEVTWGSQALTERLDWSRPVEIVVDATGVAEIAFEFAQPGLRAPGGAIDVMAGDRRLSNFEPCALGGQLAFVAPVGQEVGVVYSVTDELRREHRLERRFPGPRSAGERVLQRFEVPWTFAELRGRLHVEPQADRRAVTLVCRLDVRSSWLDVRLDEDLEFRGSLWLFDEFPRVVGLEIDIDGRGSFSHALDVLLTPGAHDVGTIELAAPVAERIRLATFRVLGVPVPETLRPTVLRGHHWPRSNVTAETEWTPLGGDLFELRGYAGEPTLRLRVATPELLGDVTCSVGDEAVPFRIRSAGTLRVELLVPTVRLDRWLELHARTDDDEPLELTLDGAGDGVLAAEQLVPAGPLRLAVDDAEHRLLELDGLVVPPGGRLDLSGPRAIDLRGRYREVWVEVRDDASAEPFAGGWICHPLQGTERVLEATQSSGPRGVLWVHDAVTQLAIEPEDGQLRVVPVNYQVTVPRIRRVPIELRAELPELPATLRACLQIRSLADTTGLAIDDPRREELGVDAYATESSFDGTVVLHEFPGTVLEARLEICRHGPAESVRVEVARHEFSVRRGQSEHRLPVVAAEIERAIRRLAQ
ncbi:MAG: carboxypeptidase regulatory-like domain-containing protein [Planctomycetes bacterium]|nr:carboxypeptidase regulatory-like domain-containing protein [Planctomycetota bacterium]